MIETYELPKWYRIKYITLGQTFFAHKHIVEVRADSVNTAAQWFITERNNIGRDCFILEIYEKQLVNGKIKWKKVFDT